MTTAHRIHRFKPSSDDKEICDPCGRGPNSAIHRGGMAPQ